MSDHPKIHERHLQRWAYVYIRQSTLRQVAEHQESQDLQYQLATRARGWGWPEERIVVIDEDLGKSAVSSSERYGFQRLFTDVGTGKVGMLLVTDVSRLARNCADWYQLLDLAAINHVLVSDSGGIYDPRAYDDRLLLGVKGAFSEAQWHIMRQQMQAARLNKAKRGELALRLPIGYERLPNGQVIFIPDEQVQTSIAQVFTLFQRLGSAHAVLCHLQQTGLRLPRQSRNALGQPLILWDKPSYSQVYQILKLPAYAGVYAYGQRQREGLPGAPGARYGGRLPPEEWQVLRFDAFPGYISWEDYMDNQERLAHNWQATPFADPAHPQANHGARNQPFSAKGAAGKGRALLVGMVICARCGRPMRVRYRDKPAYVCEATKRQFNAPRCQFFPYAHVDQVVVAAFLEAAQPAAVAAAVAAVAEMTTQQAALRQQWGQQLARAQYEVTLAQTRYEQVDPQLRLVAAALERAWEAALQAQAQLAQEWEQVQAAHLHAVSAEEVALVQQMAADLPALWAAETTTLADRKRLLRTLIADVTLDSTQEAGVTHLAVRWQTGAVTRLTAGRLDAFLPAETLAACRSRLASGETVTFETNGRRCDGGEFPLRLSAASAAPRDLRRCILAVEDVTAEKARRSEEEAIAEERRRIAREIHDGLAQDLAALRLQVRRWQALIERDPARAKAELEDLHRILGEKIREVRRAIFALRPVALDEQGFWAALERFLSEFGEQNNLQTSLEVQGEREQLPAALEPVLFRIVQEALHNVARHAQARRVWVTLDLTAGIVLRVRNDGLGFDPASLSRLTNQGHLGLRQMRERVESLGGALTIRSAPGQGTEVEVRL